MAKQKTSNRLPYKQDALFSGGAIERTRPISFKLEGQVIRGFKGDTILSALLAHSIDIVGKYNDDLISLTPEFCPPVVINSQNNKIIVPMDRTPALDGLNLSLYRTSNHSAGQGPSGVKKLFSTIFGRHKENLEFDIDNEFSIAGPWMDLPANLTKSYDLVVVGGGVAGLSAAKSAIDQGLHVALIEQRDFWGGDAEFFGAVEGEVRPAEFVFKLVETIKNSPLCDMILHTQALSLTEKSVTIHQVEVSDGEVATSLIELETKHIVLATGMVEKLPLFPGNRLPGVIGSRSAFFLAFRYGVWRGKSASLATASSIASRVALLVADLGIEIIKLADSRPNPKSRFFEFAKAYGFSLATGTLVSSVDRQKSGNLSVQFELSGGLAQKPNVPSQTDRLIICGGWQPNLALWQSIGGKLTWKEPFEQLLAHSVIKTVRLAGSCNSATTMTECKQSGAHAINSFFDTTSLPTQPHNVDLIFESFDGPLPVSKSAKSAMNCYLDGAYSLAQPHWAPKRGFWKRIITRQQLGIDENLQSIRGNSLNDVIGKTVLNEISNKYSGVFAQERSGHFGIIKILEPTPLREKSSNVAQTKPPHFLLGRFGHNARVVNVIISDRSMVEIGCLIFSNQDSFAPVDAIGSVVGFLVEQTDQIQIYVAKEYCKKNTVLSIKNGSQSIQISIL